MKFITTEKDYEYHLYDNNELVGKGYIFESKANKFYDKERVNYFIEFDLLNKDEEAYAVEILNNLVEIAKDKRKKYKEFDARVYHCCFSENKQVIKLCESIDGFKADEGMHILSLDTNQVQDISIDSQYLVTENELRTDSQRKELINQHSKSFKLGAYKTTDFDDLHRENAFKCISIRKDKELVANLLVFIKEDGIGFMEDLFVDSSVRGKGLGKYLVNYANEYLIKNDVNKIELEVWSSNYKAYNLYKKMGYLFKRESEVSIGKSI